MGGATAKRIDNSIKFSIRLHQWRIEKCAVNTGATERRSAKHPSGSDSDHEVAFLAYNKLWI